MPIADWSPTAANNGTTLGVNISEGCPPSNVNDAMRKIMADVASGINFSLLGSFLSSTSLSQAQSALGVNNAGSANTALGSLTPAANKVPYFTGASSAALADFTSFGRSVVATGDAGALRTLISALGFSTATFGSNSFDVRLTLGSDTFCIKGGTGTLGANTTGTLSFGVTFASAPVVLVSGGDSNTSSEGQIRSSAAAGTTSIAIINAGPGSGTYNWVAFGKV